MSRRNKFSFNSDPPHVYRRDRENFRRLRQIARGQLVGRRFVTQAARDAARRLAGGRPETLS